VSSVHEGAGSSVAERSEHRDAEALLETGVLQTAIFNSANFSSIATDAKGVIQIFNVGAERMLGYSAAEVVNRITPAVLSDPEELIARAKALTEEFGTPITPGFEALVFKAARGIEDIYELTKVRKDGSRFPAVVSVTALRDAQEAIIGYLLIGTDNTARKHVEDERRNAEDKFRRLMESAPDAMVIVSKDGRVLLANAQTEKLFGYERSALLGEKVELLLPERFRANATAVPAGFFAQPVAGAASTGLELFGLRKDGTEFPIESSLSPLQTEEGILVIRDISDRRRAEETAKLASQELEAFSYSVAHDLRAPLRGMNGFAQVLLDDYSDKLDAEGQDCLKEIHANALRMGGLIDALLSLSRVTRTELRPQRTDLTAIARAIVGELTAAEARPGGQVVVQSNLSADLDPQLARQLMENLIRNAWKFTSKVAVPRIEFGATSSGGTTEFFVRDNGAGFDMAHAGKLFAPFQRLHSVAEFPGTGIGLATVQRIIRRHGGRVWAEGQVGAGATFHFTVPDRPRQEAT